MFEKYLKIAQTGVSTKKAPTNEQLINARTEDVRLFHDILTGHYIHKVLEALEEDDVFYIIPGFEGVYNLKDEPDKNRFKALWPHTKTVITQTKPKLELRWAALFHDFGKPDTFAMNKGKVSFHGHESISVKYFKEFAKQYKIFTKQQYNKISFLIYNLGYVESYSSNWTESAVRRFQKEMGEHLEDLLLLSRADTTSANPKTRAKIQRKITELKQRIIDVKRKDSYVSPLPKGIGNAIISLGIPEGESVGAVKKYLEDLINKGELKGGQSIDYYKKYLSIKLGHNNSALPENSSRNPFGF